MARGATRAVQALARGIDVLDLFVTAGGPLAVPEMAKRLALPRSSVYELVQTLVDRRCLVPADGHPHRYAPGVHVLERGNAYAANLDLAREGERWCRPWGAAYRTRSQPFRCAAWLAACATTAAESSPR